jgi:flagellar hook protein FlgE
MFESIYTGLTGLATFSRGLSNISNNVANLNTVGFKRSVLQFQDLMPARDSVNGQRGNGVAAGQPHVVYKQGELRQTGNVLDAAVDGAGYFVLRDGDGKQFYTRDGQFEFNQNSRLVSRDSKREVMVLAGDGAMSAFSLAPYRSMPGAATTSISFDGTLSTGDADRSHIIAGLDVYDRAGVLHTFSLTFTDQSDPQLATADHTWRYSLRDDGENLLTSGMLRFGVDGSPALDAAPATFALALPDGTSQDIALNFGSAGKFDGLTSFSLGSDSTAKVLAVDGMASGTLTETSFDSDGAIRLEYSNGEDRTAGNLALAWFEYPQDLEPEGGNLWSITGGLAPVIGTARSAMFGTVAGGQVEASNVDLTAQFSELIVTQRGYQASSQVISTANEMMQQLFDMRGRR